MKSKIAFKITSVILILTCFLTAFHFEAFAENEFQIFAADAFKKSQPNLSGAIGELNIVPMQAILQGEEIQMTTEELGDGAHGAHVKWSSSNPNVIKCTEDGKITGVLKGKATITVKAKNGRGKDSITVYCAKKLSEPISTKVLSPIAWAGSKPNFFSFRHFFIRLFSPLFSGKAVTVKGYYDSFFYITYQANEVKYSGFIWSNFLPSNIASDQIFKQLSTYEMVVSSGGLSAEKLTTNYKGNVKWAVSDKNIISFDSSTGRVFAKKPGTALVTATVGTTQKACMVYSVSQWREPETAVSEKEVTVKKFPTITSDKVATLPKGTSMTAHGDFENGWGWIHITAGDVRGFIRVSDFPGIDYLMTEYHYYDEGFDVRYESAQSKIYEYAAVLNDVMMDNFNLKVCPYVESYTSTADRCKTLTYGSVYTNNLYAPCPKTGQHNADSCLHQGVLLEKFVADKGQGTNVTGNCVWTGHVLENHAISGASAKKQVIVFTTRNATYGTSTGEIKNLAPVKVREARVNEIVHETGHLLGLVDGYCKEDKGDNHCSNENCYKCNGEIVPDCIMVRDIISDTTTDVFCNECKETVKSHLSEHH